MSKINKDKFQEVVNGISQKELYKNFAKIDSEIFRKAGLTTEDVEWIQKRISKNPKGFLFDFKELDKDQRLSNNYFVLKEVPHLSINKQDKNNLLIEGDNYEALKALKSTGTKVDFIYIDPPYNTGKEFIYSDNYSINPKPVGNDDVHKHSKWLSFMKKRLLLAKELMNDEGVIFISIDDNEQAYLKVLMDEIFGEENFISNLSIENNPKGRKNSDFISVSSEYCLIYTKNKIKINFKNTIPKKKSDMKKDEFGIWVHNSGKRVIVGENKYNDIVSDINSDKNYNVYFKTYNHELIIEKEQDIDLEQQLIGDGYKKYFSYNRSNKVYNTYTYKKLLSLYDEKKLSFKNDKIYEKNTSDSIRAKSIWKNEKYLAIVDGVEKEYSIDLKTTSSKQELKTIFGNDIFDNPKNVSFIKNLIKLIDKKDMLILDFFAGSGTTGQAVMELNREDGENRRFILVTNNERNGYDVERNPEYGIARAVTRERLFRVINGKGSNGELIVWELQKELQKDNKKYLLENSVNYLKVETIHKVNGQFEDIDELQPLYKKEFDNKEFSIVELENE
ncbi:MAG: site-specific DNA-methyltransferase [Mycoplasmatales bacterium]|nr:site-specific DNA-methyltransferase [Mycoplasmatales bacterium]